MDKLLKFTGTVTEVIYFNKENGYSVFDFFTESEGIITCTGNLPFVNPDETLVLTGNFTMHPSYGKQFKFTNFERPEPGNETEILNFLASGIIPGVRHATAEKMVTRFGKDTLRVLEDTPERLAEIKGITLKKAFEISRSYLETKDLEELIMFVQKHGISTSFAMKIYEHYGSHAVSKIEKNPYLLCETISGISFKTADRLAQNLGILAQDENRIRAGVRHTLEYAGFSGGHTYLPRKLLVEWAAHLLSVDTLSVENALVLLLSSGALVSEIVEEEEGIFIPALYEAEKNLGESLRAMSEEVVIENKKDLEKLEEEIKELEIEQGITLAPKQKEAVKTALSYGFSVITGGPGTGKTTIIRFLLEAFSRRKKKIALCAPTGRAAKRMSQLAGEEAKTIHRLLELGYSEREDDLFRDYARAEDEPLRENVIIVDEVSMADVLLLEALVAAIPPGGQLIFVGDSDQLPPVGAGNVLKDVIASEQVPVTRLDTIFRQAEESLIVQNAHRIHRGEELSYNEKEKDFFFIGAKDAEDITERIKTLVSERLPNAYGVDALWDIQVLSPMKKTVAGVANLNASLQAVLNPPRKGKKERQSAYRILREGDKVMQVKNNYDLAWESVDGRGKKEGMGVYNGDIGVIESIEQDVVSVVFDGERRVLYNSAQLEELELAFAVTVHKSQGSEFPVVVMPVFHGVPRLMTRNLIYTAVTRASKLVVLVGQKSAIEKMVANDFEEKRYSSLRSWLQ